MGLEAVAPSKLPDGKAQKELESNELQEQHCLEYIPGSEC